MIAGIKAATLEWVNKIDVIGCTWIFVYESTHSYEGAQHVPPERKYYACTARAAATLQVIEKLY